MLYAERLSPSSLVVFSTTDSEPELQKFRCATRAPRSAMRHPPQFGRRHILLFGRPAEAAGVSLQRSGLLFDTKVDRVTWEQKQPDVMSRHPVPYWGSE